MSTANILRRVHIGEVVRNAVLFNPKNSRERAVDSDMLIETVARFFSLLSEREIEHVLVGGMALLQYVAGRNTDRHRSDYDPVFAGANPRAYC